MNANITKNCTQCIHKILKNKCTEKSILGLSRLTKSSIHGRANIPRHDHPHQVTPLFYNGITEGECDTLSGIHFKNPQAIYSGTRIKKVGLEIWPFLLEAKRSSAEARTLEF